MRANLNHKSSKSKTAKENTTSEGGIQPHLSVQAGSSSRRHAATLESDTDKFIYIDQKIHDVDEVMTCT